MDSRTTEYSKENQLIVPGKLGLWLLISLLFTVIQIQHSLREGRLAFPLSMMISRISMTH
jgi:hypothetical protein